jgi:hypothetical protein
MKQILKDVGRIARYFTTSRKALEAFVAWLACVALVLTGNAPAERLIDATIALSGFVILSIAWEDAAVKSNPAYYTDFPK